MTNYETSSKTIDALLLATPDECLLYTAEQAEKIRELMMDIQDVLDERAERGAVIKAMGVVAEVLQVDLPSTEACKIHADVVREEVPASFLQATAKELIRTYKYRSFPNPADWINASMEATRQLRAVKTAATLAYGRWRVHTHGKKR